MDSGRGRAWTWMPRESRRPIQPDLWAAGVRCASMKRLWALIVVALTLAGCGGTAPAGSTPAPASSAAAAAKPSGSGAAKPSAASGGLTKVTIAFSNIAGSNLAAWTALDGGYFQKNGLDVDLTLIAGGSRTMAALLAGDVQLILAGGGEALGAASQGADLLIIGTQGPVYPYKFMVAKEIQKPEDLKGKSVGIASYGGSSDIATRVVLRRLGLDPDKDVTFVSLSDAQTRSAALLSGKVQAGVDSPPGTIKLEQAGMHALVNLAAEKIPADNNTIVGQRSWVNANKATAQKIVDSLVQGAARAKKDREFGLATMKKYYKNDNDAEMRPAYEFTADETMPALPYPKPEQFKDTLEQLSVKNEKLKNFDVTKMLDESFVKSAADRGLDKA